MSGMLLNSYIFGAVGGLTKQGNVGTSGGYWWLGYAGGAAGTLYAMLQTAEPNGTGTVYRSTNGGVTWTQGASVTGAGSSYGFSILALSSTTVIVQHRGYFYRSTDSGASFSTILTTSGGQNNFYNISSDGTYGVCAGYDQIVTTSNNWVSASTASKPYGYSMATAALTNNGSNRFTHAGLGSSGSPATAYVATNAGSTVAGPISLTGNQNNCASNPATGLNAIIGGPEGSATFGIIYATYPSTTYSSANVTGMGTVWAGNGAISPQGKIVVPMNTGIWNVNTAGTAPTLISSFADFQSAVSDGTTYCYAIRQNGDVYRFTAS